MPTYYTHPERVTKHQLLWLELEEFPDRPMVAVRVFDVLRGHRAQVEILASDHKLVNVDFNRLFQEEVPR